jgi:hypothetical protein
MEGIPAAPDTWLSAIRRYLAVIAVGNLLWEFAQMPLYTLWRTGTVGGIVSAALHCTGGDVLIATAALVLALVVVGSSAWPRERFLPVAIAAMALGLGYTVFSEWLNIEVRRTWAYSDLMPVLPWLGTGLSPLAQWLVVPALAFRSVQPRPAADATPSEPILHHGDAR